MVDKIILFVLIALAGWAIAASLAVFRYRRAADGSLEENGAIGVAEMIVRILAGLACCFCFRWLFVNELATLYIELLDIDSQAAIVGEWLVTPTALVVGILHLVLNFALCKVLAQMSNYYLLRAVQPPPESSAEEPKQETAPPATKHAARTSRRHSNTASDQLDPMPVYGTAEPIRVERAPHNITTGPHFTMKACDLVAAMKDAGWRLNREPKAPAIPAPETTTINV